MYDRSEMALIHFPMSFEKVSQSRHMLLMSSASRFTAEVFHALPSPSKGNLLPVQKAHRAVGFALNTWAELPGDRSFSRDSDSLLMYSRQISNICVFHYLGTKRLLKPHISIHV